MGVKIEREKYSRLTVSSPPRVSTVLPSIENVTQLVSAPFVCAASFVMLGRAKLPLVDQTWNVPSRPVAPRFFPSGEYAHAVILVRVPRSLDLTEMTTFCLRRFSTSQILRVGAKEERDHG